MLDKDLKEYTVGEVLSKTNTVLSYCAVFVILVGILELLFMFIQIVSYFAVHLIGIATGLYKLNEPVAGDTLLCYNLLPSILIAGFLILIVDKLEVN